MYKRHLRPFPIAQTMHQVVQQLQHPPARFLHLGLAVSHGLLQIRHLLFLLIGLLHQHHDAIKTGTIGDHRRHHRLIRRQAVFHMIQRLCRPKSSGRARDGHTSNRG